ncbi:HPP family protein [Acidobacteriota bacterium]
MKPVSAADLMSKTVISVSPLEPVSKVITIFQERRISAIPVVDTKNHLAGIVTKADVIDHAYAWGSAVISDAQTSPVQEASLDDMEWSQAQVREVMSPVLITASPGASPLELANIMKENDIHHIPITLEGKLVGIVSSIDLLKLLQP